MAENLSMDFVQGLNVKEPTGHVQSGLPIFNLQTTFEEESKDRPVDGEVQAYNSSQQAQNLDSGVHQMANPANAESFPQTVPAQQKLNKGPQKTVVGKSPQLSSGTQKAIEKVLEESLRKMGIAPQFHQDNKPENSAENLLQSTARNRAGSNAGNTHFSFPNLSAGSASNAEQKQIFATGQWRPKEPPAYTSAASYDVYIWASLVRQYFVFMQGSPQQEVVFAATLLRSTAHEWYLGYEEKKWEPSAKRLAYISAGPCRQIWFQYLCTKGTKSADEHFTGQTHCPQIYFRVSDLARKNDHSRRGDVAERLHLGTSTTSGESRGSQIPDYHFSGVGSY